MHPINKKTTLQFPDEFFREEVRCGYIVSEKLKRIWAVEIDLLNELLRVCKKHNIKIIVYAGTLLGTIRHKGMIPWDDDIDVALTRPEYEKLCEIASDEFKHPYFFQTALTDNKSFFGYARLRNSLTTGYILSDPITNYNQGIYIDIFVVDGYVEDKRLLEKQLKKKLLLTRLSYAHTMNVVEKNLLKKLVKYVLFGFLHYTLCKVISYNMLVRLYEQNLKKYNNSSKRVTLMTHPLPILRKYWCSLDDFNKIIDLPFENIYVPTPSNYHEMLTNMYGDYMRFPPVNKRGIWHEGQLVLNPDIKYDDFFKNRNYDDKKGR